MTISSSTNSISYTGNGITTSFAYTFPIQSNTWLGVYVNSVLQTLTLDYSVTGVGGSGGNVVFVSAPTGTVFIARDHVPETQLTDYVQGDPFPADSHEQALDKLTVLVQQLDLGLSNAITIPGGEQSVTMLPAAASRANLLLGFDDNGDVEMVTYVPGDPTNTFIQSGSGAVARAYQDKVREIVSPTDFAVSLTDSATDDTTAMNNAVAVASYELTAPAGTYNINSVQLDNVSIRGMGHNAIFKANSTNCVLKLGTSTPDLWSKRSIRNLTIDGHVNVSHGLQFGSVSNTQNAGRWIIDQVTVQNCNYGIYKPNGNIGNVIRDSNIINNNIGYLALGSTSPIMHAGNDTITDTQFAGNALAALYIETAVSGSGGTELRNNVIIEGNPGFGIFVQSYSDGYTPLVLDGVWFENNATAGSVVINSTSYTPKDIYLKDCAECILRNGIIPSVQLVNSRLNIDDCTLTDDATSFSIDSTSVCFADNIRLSGGLQQPIEIRSITGVGGTAGNFAITAYSPRRLPSHDQRGLLQSITFATANTYTFTGSGSYTATTQADGLIFDSACELTLVGAATLTQPSVSITTGRYYVTTLDAKLISGTQANLTMSVVASTTLVPDMAPLLKTGRWVTLMSVSKSGASNTVQLRLINSTSGNIVVRLSAFQIAEFTTEEEAMEFYNDRRYITPTLLPRVVFNTTTPATGTWAVGDTTIAINPAAGNPVGWKCTVAGTPGTWVALANL